jgi:hypothetical protein
MTDTRKAIPLTIFPDAILKKQMSAIHSDLDAIAIKSHYAMTRDQQIKSELWDCGS